MSADVETVQAPRRALDSSLESQIRPFRLLLLAVATIVALRYGYTLFFQPAARPAAAVAAPVGTAAVVVVTATPTETSAPTATPVVVVEYVDREVEVTREVSRYVYESVPVEVTRIVEVTPATIPTVTPVPLAAGVVRICVSAERVRELYVDGQGIVGGGCVERQVGVGATYVTVQINR